jgi:hypothetical protein
MVDVHGIPPHRSDRERATQIGLTRKGYTFRMVNKLCVLFALAGSNKSRIEWLDFPIGNLIYTRPFAQYIGLRCRQPWVRDVAKEIGDILL